MSELQIADERSPLLARASDGEVYQVRMKVQTEISENNHWRAKEAVRNSIAQHGYDTRLFEILGEVLLAMHDTLDAGRWLFLSGSRHADYQEAIELFLERHSKKGGAALYHSFPACARIGGPDAYPEPLRTELREMGLQDIYLSEASYMYANEEVEPPPPTLTEKLGTLWALCFGFAVLIFILASLIIGGKTILDWIGSWFG